jgi:hypothetical protein
MNGNNRNQERAVPAPSDYSARPGARSRMNFGILLLIVILVAMDC